VHPSGGTNSVVEIGPHFQPVAAENADLARTWDADLIVSGARRHRDLAALIVGSTDHELTRQAHRPVLIAARSKD
jgi:nucleotide-binding universal stress UspA family protein